MERPTGLRLDPRSSQPLFEQIAEALAARIRSGTFPPGHRLPTTRALAQELKANRNTVVRAYEELAQAGLTSSGVGRGTFVARLPPTRKSAVTERPELPWASLLSRAASSEALGRQERLPHRAGPTDVIQLTRLQPSPDLLPHEELRRCIDHVLRVSGPEALGYAPREGLPRLRTAIAADLARLGVPAAPEEILITTGSSQGLDSIIRTLTNPGDRVLVESETYYGVLSILGAAGASAVSVPGDEEGPDLANLDSMARGARALYLIPNHRNPTGTTIGPARRQGLVEWSHASGVPLIEDDYGADLDLDGRPLPPALRALDREVLYVGSYSKRLSPALRVGFIVAPPGIRGPLLSLRHAMDLGTSNLLQHALAEFLERGYLVGHLARTLPVYRRRRDALEAALKKHLPREVSWSHLHRGVVTWLTLPEGMDPESVFAEAMGKGVLVSPGTLHAVSGRSQGIRLSICMEPERRIAEGVRRLSSAIEAVSKERRGKPAAGSTTWT